jgi:heme O synthase-like polyprenyltransferase
VEDRSLNAVAQSDVTTATHRAGIAARGARWPVAARQRLRDYVTLTKPRIISLLLVTTWAPMVIALRGWPAAALVLWTLLGGYLMAGGANAVNMYMDRDIDARMPRTRCAPSPAGGCRRAHVLASASRWRRGGVRCLRGVRQRALRGARARGAATTTSSSTRAGSSAPRRRTS